jgi:hypothetical protein
MLPISYSPRYCTSGTVVLFLFGRMREVWRSYFLLRTIDPEVSSTIAPGKLSDIDIIELHRYCRRTDDLSLEVLLHYALQEGCVQNGIDISSDGPRPSETRQSLSSQNLSEELADALPLRSAHRTRVNTMIPTVTSLIERCGPDACPSVMIGSHVPGDADA